jgi:hypothetical protein
MTHTPEPLIPCFGCGAMVPDTAGPTHAYIGASSGCWAVYTDILAAEYGAFQYPDCHRLTVDAYAVQHPGVAGPQSIRSVAVHLIGLHLVLERGYDATQTTRSIAYHARNSDAFVWLHPPANPATLTVLDVRGATTPEEHTERVGRWARSVWDAWQPHHEIVREWACDS